MTYYDKAAEIMINGMGHMRGKSPMANAERFSQGEMFVLNSLYMQDASMSAGEIGECMDVSSARIASVLGKLENKGYVERHIDKSDRRKVEVILTESGRHRVACMKDEVRRRFAMTFKKMGKRDTEEFLRLMRKFFTTMANIPEESDGDN